MRARASAVWLSFCVCWASGVWAQSGVLDPGDLQNLLKTREGTFTSEAPRIVQGDDGFVTFIGAPPGDRFMTPAARAKAVFSPEGVAANFVNVHGGAFGVQSPASSFGLMKVHTRGGRAYVHLGQRYGGVKVFCGQIMVQVDGTGGVEAVLSDIMRNTERLDSGEVSLTPLVSALEARSAALVVMSAGSSYAAMDLDSTVPELVIYRPSVLGGTGATRLVWNLVVTASGVEPLRERVLVDASSGDVVLRFTLIETADPADPDRKIYDARNTFVIRANLVREENDPPVDEPQEVNDAFELLGDTYYFYSRHHDRDSIDNAGATMHATVRFGSNFANAFWNGTDMVFGEGFLVDDVTGHELTHGVTEFTSGLVYLNESGAINESFSDIWGEFIDLENRTGDDSDEVRWLMGEEARGGAIRNMADPPEFGWFPFDRTRWHVTPDRYNHPDFYRGLADNGGVHFNSGVGNKLCYLLTDGDTFNGYTVRGMGIDIVADLFYETQSILTPGSGYFDLYSALGQAAANLELSFVDRMNVFAACKAVEIEAPDVEKELENFRAIPASNSEGTPVVVVQWKAPSTTGLRILGVVRKVGSFPTSLEDGVRVDDESGELEVSYLVDGADGSLTSGEDYFYAAFWDARLGFLGVSFSRATAGAEPSNYLTEEFSTPAGTPIDLSFSQLLFSPIIDPEAADASGLPREYVNHSNYTVAITRNVYELPISRLDGNGGAVSLPMTEDGVVAIPLEKALFPYFGNVYNRIALAANGYVDLRGGSCEGCFDNFPSQDAHGDHVRISFLFADLGLSMGGSVWTKAFDDRLVVTYENVPEWSYLSPSASNTVQVELFFSGHVRITYLELNVEHAVVGLSDGKGSPVDPMFLLSAAAAIEDTDFSEAAVDAPDRLTLWPPVPIQSAVEGETVEFAVATNSPNGVPRLSATWNREGAVPFSDLADGTGVFFWRTDSSSSGATSVRITATLGSEKASQEVAVVVAGAALMPEARYLTIGTGVAGEDPSVDHEVDTDESLTAGYTFTHPLQTRPDLSDPVEALEGTTSIRWYRDGGRVSHLTDVLQVPPGTTGVGDTWFFTVTPETLFGVVGETVQSPRVTITGNPIIASVSPSVGDVLGGDVVRITGRHLSNPLSVTFGGIRGEGLVSLGDEELEVISPISRAGLVDLVVTTDKGAATIEDGYTAAISDIAKEQADVNLDGTVDALDVQLVIAEVLRQTKALMRADTNRDGQINSTDVQVVVNVALAR